VIAVVWTAVAGFFLGPGLIMTVAEEKLDFLFTGK